MSDPLATYINDHLAGSAYAIDLVEVMRDTYEGKNWDSLLRGCWRRSKRTERFCKGSRSGWAAVPARRRN
jgi:hypothetical protein